MPVTKNEKKSRPLGSYFKRKTKFLKKKRKNVLTIDLLGLAQIFKICKTFIFVSVHLQQDS